MPAIRFRSSTKRDDEDRFSKHVDYAVGGDAELATDLNDDGLPDLVTGNEDTRDLSILINRGDGTFEPEARLPVYCLPDELVAADFNGDGHQDLAVVSRENKLVVLLGLGDRFEQSPIRVGDHPEVVVWQDTNGTWTSMETTWRIWQQRMDLPTTSRSCSDAETERFVHKCGTPWAMPERNAGRRLEPGRENGSGRRECRLP